MNRVDLIMFNSDIMRKLKDSGIRLDDYKYADLWRDYVAMVKTAKCRKSIILSLSEKYGLSDRHVYNILKHLNKKVD